MRITEVQEPYRYLYKGQSVWLMTIRFSGKRPDLGTILVANNQHLIVAMHLHGDHPKKAALLLCSLTDTKPTLMPDDVIKAVGEDQYSELQHMVAATGTKMCAYAALADALAGEHLVSFTYDDVRERWYVTVDEHSNRLELASESVPDFVKGLIIGRRRSEGENNAARDRKQYKAGWNAAINHMETQMRQMKGNPK